jgi:hypothetical protein
VWHGEVIEIEVKTMKRQSSFVLVSTLGVAIIVLVGALRHWPQTVTPDAARHANAAFRDGLFQARLDVQNGRKARIASGRWSTDQDRASFVAGYEQTYRELSDARSAKPAAPTATELAGYRDGKLDGTRDRKTAQLFQMNKTENYRKADQDYRAAYSTGYQVAYYAGTESADLKTISEKSGPF